MKIRNELAAFALAGITAICASCTADTWNVTDYHGLEIHSNKSQNFAIAGHYNWDGTDEGRTIEIPDTVEGVPVTRVGSTPGSDKTEFFVIKTNDNAQKLGYRNCDAIPDYDPGAEYSELVFNVNIGANVEKVWPHSSIGSSLLTLTDVNGNKHIYEIAYYYTCSKNNTKLYAKDGMLYSRSDDTLINLDYADGKVEIADESTVAQTSAPSESGDTLMTTTNTAQTDTNEPLFFAPGIWQTIGNGKFETYYYFSGDGKGETRMQQDGKGKTFTYRFENGRLILQYTGSDFLYKADVTEKEQGVIVIEWETVQSQTLKYLGGFDFNWFTFYPTDELVKMAGEYFKSRNGFMPERIEGFIDQNEMVCIQVTERVYTGDDIPACDFAYIIDRFTAKGTQELGKDAPAVDLADMYYDEPVVPEAWTVSVPQRQQITDSGKQIGAAFLGTYDESSNMISVIKSSGLSSKLDFLSEMPVDRYAQTVLGLEIYLIVPRDPASEVTVRELLYDDSTYSDIPDDVIYHSTDGEPFVIRCNESSRRADVVVTITDSSGNTYEWMPNLITSENGEKSISDPDETVLDLSK